MSGLAGYARGGQGGGVSKSQKAREGTVQKAGKPFPGAKTPFGGDSGDSSGSEDDSSPKTPMTEEATATPAKSMAEHARSGNVVTEKMVVAPEAQPSVPSNIPGAGAQGVPPAEADELGAFARRGNADMIPTVVNAQTGLATHGPAVVASLARMGGQVQLAPGQFGVWAHPRDPAPKAGGQYGTPAPAPAVY